MDGAWDFRRIVVHGCTGSGKTTAAQAIGQQTGIPVIDGDALCWMPGWQGVPRQDQMSLFAEVIQQPVWVLDETGPGDMVCDVADLVILLDYPRWFSFQRLLRRSVHRVVRRTVVCNGNYESWSKLLGHDSILLWHFRSWKRKHEQMNEMSLHRPDKTLLIKRPAELNAWISKLSAAPRRASRNGEI